MRAGVSITDISPREGVGLAGYPHCPRPNRGVHDPLYAACIFLDDGATKVAVVTLDLLYLGKQYVAKVREKFDFFVSFTCSHTHSGPWAAEPLASEKAEGIECDSQYTDGLVAKLTELIRQAAENTFDAELGSGVGMCGASHGVGGNRREKGGICDSSVNVLAVRERGGEPRGILVNYALHPTYLHAENELVSADYPAYIRRYLGFAQPEAIMLFAQGTSGNQSSRYHRVAQDFEEAARVGTTIGVEVQNVLNNMTFTSDLKICIKSREIELPLKRQPELSSALAELKKAEGEFEKTRTADYITARNAELALFGAQNTVNFARFAAQGYRSPELPTEIELIELGDTVIVGIQGELFVEFGLAVKEISPFEKTFVFEVTNGAAPGYAYTAQAAAEGGYEVGTSMLAPDAGDMIVKTVKEMF